MKIEKEINMKTSSLKDYDCDINLNPSVVLEEHELKILQALMFSTWQYFVKEYLIPKENKKRLGNINPEAADYYPPKQEE